MSSPIIIQLKGGLGNQIFQFAFGQWLNDKHNRDIYFDASLLFGDSRPREIAVGKLFSNYTFKYTIGNSFNIPNIRINLDLAPSVFCEGLLNIKEPMYISGYFQNSNYYSLLINKMRNLLDPEFSRAHVSSKPDEIQIGVHVRRGDYLTKLNTDIHGIVPLEDILNQVSAIYNKISNHVQNITIKIFSDSDIRSTDIDVLSIFSHLPILYSDNKSYMDDFTGMMDSDFLFCSNSTFSYWAGMLSEKVKFLMIPMNWMKKDLVRSTDLILPKVKLYNNRLF